MEKEKLSEIEKEKEVIRSDIFDVAMRVIRKTFVYKGRASKTELQMWVVFCLASFGYPLMFFCFIPGLILYAGLYFGFMTPKFCVGFVVMILKMFSVLFCTLLLFIPLPTISVVIRRLHDTNRSGWWVGGTLIAVFVFLGIFCLDEIGFHFGVFLFFVLFPGLIIMISFGCVSVGQWCMEEGTHGPNKYGEEPKYEVIEDI